MTDNEYSFEDRLDHVCELHGIDPSNVCVSKRDIGNGPQYAVEMYDSDSSTMIFESNWYARNEFDAYLTALSNLHTMLRKQ
jgi:hypothetical protein